MGAVKDFLSVGVWTDCDLSYNPAYDFSAERRDIALPNGKLLRDVSILKHNAEYSVHFCAVAQEIWAVDVAGLVRHLEFGSRIDPFYSPRRRLQGEPTARGYAVPCFDVAEFGHCWPMPAPVADRLLGAKNKGDVGKCAEKAFLWLVNDRRFFPTIFLPVALRASRTDDIAHGIDFVVGDLPVQVKYDGPGGSRKAGGTGNLFIQTHTLPMSDAKSWHGYEYESR